MMAVDIETEPDLRVGTPRELFRTPFAVAPIFDVSPDGQRFLFIQTGDRQADGGRLNIVLNWFEELRRLVPTN